MDEAFVLSTFIGGIFGIMGLLLLNHNWFSREKFKVLVAHEKKKNDLEIKRLAREYGLPMSSSKKSFSQNPQSPAPLSSSLLDLAKGLDRDQISAILEIVSGGGEEGSGTLPEGMDDLISFATKNPELVKGFLGGIQKKEGSGDSETGFI